MLEVGRSTRKAYHKRKGCLSTTSAGNRHMRDSRHAEQQRPHKTKTMPSPKIAEVQKMDKSRTLSEGRDLLHRKTTTTRKRIFVTDLGEHTLQAGRNIVAADRSTAIATMKTTSPQTKDQISISKIEVQIVRGRQAATATMKTRLSRTQDRSFPSKFKSHVVADAPTATAMMKNKVVARVLSAASVMRKDTRRMRRSCIQTTRT